MGNKNKKNSNYVTDKTIRAKEEKERAQKRKKQKKIVIAIVAAVLSVAVAAGSVIAIGSALGWWGQDYEPKVTHHANITIEGYGTLHVELYGEEAPETVKNFVNLANEGFYDGLTFSHLMQNPNNKENILIQTGEDVDGLEPIEGEYSANDVDNKISHVKGILSSPKHKTGVGTNPTKFFIMTSSDYDDTFDGFYAAFGKVTSGLDILDEICEIGENNIISDGDKANLLEIHPKKQAKITSITIHEAH